jgi:hypothetical protein
MDTLEKTIALFDEFLNNTPQEELNRLFDEMEGLKIPGPTIGEYLDKFDHHYYPEGSPVVRLDALLCIDSDYLSPYRSATICYGNTSVYTTKINSLDMVADPLISGYNRPDPPQHLYNNLTNTNSADGRVLFFSNIAP